MVKWLLEVEKNGLTKDCERRSLNARKSHGFDVLTFSLSQEKNVRHQTYNEHVYTQKTTNYNTYNIRL